MNCFRWISGCALATTLVVAQQPNAPLSTMKIDGNDGPTYPMNVSVRTNTTSTISILGGVGARFLTCVSATGQLQLFSAPIFGDKLDLPFNPPVGLWLNGFYGLGVGAFQTGPLGQKDVPVSVPGNLAINSTIAIQTAMDDVSSPFGLSLTTAALITVTQGPTVTSLAFTGGNDEGYSTISLPAGMSVPFYGTAYTKLHVYTNGYIVPSNTTTAPASDFTPSAGNFALGTPRIAMFWCDQDITGGVCISTVDANPPGLAPFVDVSFQGNSDFGGGGTIHNYSARIDTAGILDVVHPFTNSASVFYTSLVGICAGSNLGPNSTIGKDLSVLDTNGYTGALNENFFEEYASSQGNIGFVSYDLQGRTLTFIPIGSGTGATATNTYFLF
jgi:hypothetical protein